MKDKIELIVFDNKSTDQTYHVVDAFIQKGFSINYYKNEENIGADRNIAACYLKAKGKYVWVFSDDDFILPGYLKLIFDLLINNNFGCIYVNSVWYSQNEYHLDSRLPLSINYNTYNNPISFIEKVNYWTTFITGNIINKQLFTDFSYIAAYYNTNLVQLAWVLPAVFKAEENAIINDQVIACKAENTGGYDLIQVFGKNFNNILNTLIERRQIDGAAKKIINTHLLHSFFPSFINKAGKNPLKVSSLKIMILLYWNQPVFWLKVFPAFFK